ncbi:two component transcriptional regulator, LuxR family [Dyadobacter koreensis]|uniref:Two component transcriptional regulator, LuxR family n=1 Tax=Dyadobacter koreensis TaxID=408657 RepID=A0A1H6QJE3_9BACT|nr:response regulator transcription factor [Dyadobacter koreensis]SEI43733.1 two component transcriptional regulator, LuxR family [Dyadobacter koreensis]
MKKIAVFLVDDHEIFRNGLKQLINAEADMEVVGEASTGEDAIQSLAKTSVDVIIMDIRMPGISGLDTGKSVLKDNSKAKLLFFSLFDNPDYVLTALDMGASGYILKDTSNKIFLHAIRTVHNGQFYFIGDVTDTLVRKYHEQRNSVPDTGTATASETSLSKREQQIIRMIDQGVTNKEIAEALGISIRTIEAHRLNILRKFQVSTIEEAVENARASSLLA